MNFDRLPNGRKVLWVGKQGLRLAFSEGGGHIAALRLGNSPDNANPYWQPPWPSHEPKAVDEALVHAEYGGAPEGRLLASILGHSLALDLYGPPSAEEIAEGAVTHGKAGVLQWDWEAKDSACATGTCQDDFAQLRFSRRLQVDGYCAVIEEKLENLCKWDRPIAWQQHVSFGSQFCEEGFWSQSNCDPGRTHPQSFVAGAGLLPDAETTWPLAPLRTGAQRDYRCPIDRGAPANDFAGYRVQTMDSLGYFVAGNTNHGFAVFYIWPRRFFPWLGVWDEKNARTAKPWCGRTSVRAYEFGVSPFPESRRDMLRRAVLFGVPTYLMLSAAGAHWVRYLLGVFPGVNEPGALHLSASAVTLLKEGREICHTDLHGSCASSARAEMEQA